MSQRQPKSYMRKNKIAGQFSARTIAMMESPAFQVLSLSGRRVLDRLEIEHAHHGGNDNGELPCTYDDFADYGMDRHAIKAAINEVAALGFVEITEPGRAGNAEWRRPNKFRLTYRQVGRANPTDEWSRIKTMEQAATVAKMARGKNISQWGKTPILGGETPTTERPIHSGKTPTTGHGGKTPTTSISRNQRGRVCGAGQQALQPEHRPPRLRPVRHHGVSRTTVRGGGVMTTPPSRSTGWAAHPNLLRGANSSRNKNRGRLQVQIRRAFIDHPLPSSSEVYDFTHAKCRALKQPIPTLHRYSVWRVLREIADPVARSRGPGRPWLWRLRDPAVQKASEN
jgi:hypothetical protein